VAGSDRDARNLATVAADLTVVTRTIDILNELIGGAPGFHLT
jgi:hypothetical protein